MTTQISKIKLRQGNFTDLPILDTGELGYATDAQRLFIGNAEVTVGTGNGAIDTFIIPLELSDPTSIIAILIDGNEVNAADYSVNSTTLLFSTPPANGAVITAKYNSEVEIKRFSTNPYSVQLPANGNLANTGFSLDTRNYNVVIMDYTLSTSNGVRVGQLRFGTDTNASTTMLDDNYTETGTVDIVFNADISISDTLKLQYTDNDNAIATFKYTYQLWNSN